MHTPEPWHAEERGKEVQVWSERKEGDVTMRECVAVINGLPNDITRADGRLTAAAPELLEALKYARRFLNNVEHDVSFIDAAIAKATGE